MLPSDALATFAVFAEHLNFTRAARALHLSQPAVFQHVKRLTEATATPLYERRGHRLELTAAGKRVAAFARDLEAQTRALHAELAHQSDGEPVVLCAGEGAYLYLLGGGISRFVAAGAPLRLMTRDADGTLEALQTGQAHLGVAVLDQPPDDLDAHELLSAPQVLLVPKGHPLARKRSCRLADLGACPLVAPPRGRPLRALLDLAARRASLSLNVVVEATGWPLMIHFVQLGVGLAVVNGCCRLPAGLVAVPLSDLPPTRYLLLRRKGPAPSPQQATLWSMLSSISPL